MLVFLDQWKWMGNNWGCSNSQFLAKTK